jgi:hypothetical protein
MRPRFKPYALPFIGVLLFCPPATAVGQLDENLMKAVAIEKISRFVQWPEEDKAIAASQGFIICVFGQHPVAERSGEFYAERRIKDKTVKIRHLSNVEDVADCHLIYLTESSRHDLRTVLATTGNKPILTVGDCPGYAEKGILVNFYITQQKLRFEINETGFHKAGLKVAPILLKVADIVNPLGNLD